MLHDSILYSFVRVGLATSHLYLFVGLIYEWLGISLTVDIL